MKLIHIHIVMEQSIHEQDLTA